jgi:hypothetical protein
MGFRMIMQSSPSGRTFQSLRFGTRARDDGIGRVLYWSSRAVALLFHNRVVTLLNRYGALLPSAVIVDIDRFPRISSGYFEGERIILDSMKIKLSNPIDLSFKYNSRPPIDETLRAIRPYLKIKNYSIASAVLRFEGELSDLSGIEKVVSNKQFNILENNRTPDIAAKNLLGLGFGLTPSGDDFALGVISIFNLLGEDTSRLKQAVMAYDYPLSRTMLIDALDGYYSEPVYNLMKSLCSGPPTRTVLSDIVKVGHSSGSDILAGIYYTLSSLLWHFPIVYTEESQTAHISSISS